MKEDSNWWGVAKLVIGVIALCFLVHGGKGKNGGREDAVKPDTIYTVYTDTIHYYKPVPKDSVVIRYVTAQFPASVPKTSQNTPKTSQNVPDDKEDNFLNKDHFEDMHEMVPPDSVDVQIPITQTVYEDSTYTAYVSGYRASLDSLIFRMPRETMTITKYPKPKRWSVGIQVGYGMTLKGTPQFSPYIGIGVSYNLFSF